MKRLYRAILRKNYNILKDYISFKKLLKYNDMVQYLYIASKRIINYSEKHKFIKEHIVVDYQYNDVWLDIDAYIKLKEIILGYIEPYQYINILESLNQNRMKNSVLREIIFWFQNKSTKKIIKVLINGVKKKYTDYNLNITLLAFLELISRNILVKKYFCVEDKVIKKRAQKLVHNMINYTNNKQAA